MKSEQLLSSSRLRYLIPEISNAEILRDIYDGILMQYGAGMDSKKKTFYLQR